MVKIHLFVGIKRRGTAVVGTRPMGHLYSSTGDRHELEEVASTLLLDPGWLQRHRSGLLHFELWGRALARARIQYPTVGLAEFKKDIATIRRSE